MKKSTILAIALAVSMSGFTSGFAAERTASNYDTVAKTDASGNATYLHASAVWDGAYFPQDKTVPAQYEVSIIDPNRDGGLRLEEVSTDSKGITTWKIKDSKDGYVYSAMIDGHRVFNLNPFSGDDIPTAEGTVSIPSMQLPSEYSKNASSIQQYYLMDYAATLTGFEAEKRINADNQLHQDDVKSIGMSIDASGNITTGIKFNDGSSISDSVGIGDYVKNNAGNASYNGTTTTINQAIQSNTDQINIIKNNNVTHIEVSQDGDTMTITQTINGTPADPLVFNDQHVEHVELSLGGYNESADKKGVLTTTITDNFGNKYSGGVNISGYVSDAIKAEAAEGNINYAGSTESSTPINIQGAINNNYNLIQNNYNEIQKGWNAQINGTTVNNVKMGEGLNFVNGDNNITLSTNNDGDIIIGTNKDVSFDSVTSNSVNTKTITTNSIKVGNTYIDKDTVSINNKITNVHPGDVSESSTDAVNGSQLYQTNQRVTNLEGNVAKLGSRVNKVGANAAALAALHPMDFDPDDKLSFAAGAGNYGGENAMAIGMFYRPSEKVMLSAGGSMGNGENMVNMGVAFALDRPNVSNTKVAMAKEIIDLREHIDRQDQQISQLMTAVSTLTGQALDNRGKDFFPDVPENHWAYEYVKGLFEQGIIEGYPDGMFSGERTATRYEFAAMLYRALKKGVDLDSRIMSEFQPELSRIRVDRIYGDICDRDKVERVRVNLSKDTDRYGSKCK